MFIFVPLSLRIQALLNLDTKSLGQIIQSYAQTNQLNTGKELHCQLLRSRYPICTFIANQFINFYSKCGLIRYAHNMFDEMPERDIVSWTSMITAFDQNSKHPEALRVFSMMRVAGERPTQFAFSSALRACASLRSVGSGKQMHCLVLKCGLGSDVYVGSNLAGMYSKFGANAEACRVFEDTPRHRKDVVLWAATIDGYVKNGEFDSALLAFKMMKEDGIKIDARAINYAISACASMEGARNKLGKCIQSSVVKLGFELNRLVSNSLVDMYMRSGDFESASNMFAKKCG